LARPRRIEIAVSGPDIAISKAHAEKLLAETEKSSPPCATRRSRRTLDFPTVNVQIDRERAGLLGVEVEDVARSLVAATTSSRFTVPNFWADPGTGISYNLQVQIPEERTHLHRGPGNIPITSSKDEPVLLRNLAEDQRRHRRGHLRALQHRPRRQHHRQHPRHRLWQRHQRRAQSHR
jgi:multidrug efflux pump subunit AcrB